MLSLIVAMAANSVIGFNNKLPFKISEDLKYFRKKTYKKTIIMGRKTFLSLPYILPERKHIVLSKNSNFIYKHPQVLVYNNIKDLVSRYVFSEEECFVIGGSQIYDAFLPHCKTLYITKIFDDFIGDTYFNVNYSDFYLMQQSDLYFDEALNTNYQFFVYNNKNF